MEKYPIYKDSGIKWIGEIPEHWIVLKINKLFSVKAGGDAKPDFYSYDKDEEHPFPVYTNTIDEKVYAYTSQAIFKSNSITVTGRGAIGHAIYRDTTFDAIIRLLVLAPKKQTYNCKFFTFFIDVVIPFFSDSAAIGQLSAVQLSNFHTVAPPLHEQQSIVTFLEKETGNIDAYIKQRQQEIIALNELKQAEIAEVVTKGINPDAPMKDSGIPWVGQIPEHWDSRFLFQVSKEHYISNKNVLHQNLLSLSYGKIVNKDINKTDGLLPANFDTYQVVEDGNLILRLTDLQNDHKSLRVGFVTQEGIITSAYVCLEAFNNMIPKYLYYSLHSFDIKKVFYSMGGGLRQGLNYAELRKLNVIVPPKEEQQQIVEYIESRVAIIEEQISIIKLEIEQMQEYKQCLISDAVTGKIKV